MLDNILWAVGAAIPIAGFLIAGGLKTKTKK
jgi:hypothetical protein